MKRKHYIQIGRIALVVGAYGYLVYRLAVYGDYALWQAQLSQATLGQYLALALCVLLFPLNQFLEACKWRYLMRSAEPMTLCEAQRQVYYGMVGAFVTPYRAGDYPARICLMRDRSKWPAALGLALVGSVALTMVIVVIGLPAVLLFFARDSWHSLWQVFVSGGVCVLLLVVLPWLLKRLAKHPWKHPKVQQLFLEMGTLGYGEWMCVLALSALRYLCFGLQMYLALLFCGVCLAAEEALVAIPLYYLLVTVTPNIPIADLGIRGSWAMLVFGHWGVSAPMCAVATALMWLSNTVLPMLVGAAAGATKRQTTDLRQ